MRAASAGIMFIVVAAALAGCLNDSALPGPTTGAPDPANDLPMVSPDRLPIPDHDFTNAIDPDHGGIPDGHAVAALHAHDFGFELVGYHPLRTPIEGTSPAGQDVGYAGIDVWDTYACISHFAGSGGATLVDIADPAAPRVVSSVESGMVNSDCQFTDDGRFLFLGAYTGADTPATGRVPLPPPVSDLAARGVLVYDVEDKANPVFLFHDQQGAGGDGYHNLFTAQINGQNYLFQTYTGNILLLNEERVELEIVAQVGNAEHDMWVGQHPATGDWVMITGAGGGVVVYDVNDPSDPVTLGEWGAHDGYAGWHRQWPLTELVDGRALMLVGGETSGGSTLPYTVLDFTDPLDLAEVGHWQIPGAPESAQPNFFTMSAHEFESWDGYVATANYHAGLWLIDIGTLERASSPVTLAYYLPHEVPAASTGVTNLPFAFNPYVWSAAFDERGYVVAADWASGFYVLSFGATQTGA